MAEPQGEGTGTASASVQHDDLPSGVIKDAKYLEVFKKGDYSKGFYKEHVGLWEGVSPSLS